jgi:ADP-ribose pyrophosphatase YjhB (NUDIX family)
VTYHLQQLVSKNIVTKDGNTYQLTNFGKDTVGNFDRDYIEIEKQPKICVLIQVLKWNEDKNCFDHLVCRRLKQPYMYKIGRVGKKVRFGETFEEAASREMLEETCLMRTRLELKGIYHKLRSDSDGKVVQDTIFVNFTCTEFSGNLENIIQEQENFWVSECEFDKRPDLDFLMIFSTLTKAQICRSVIDKISLLI